MEFKQKDIIKLPKNETPQPQVLEHPWITTPQYEEWIEFRIKTFATASIAIPISTTTGEYDLTSIDIGFTPRAIRIQALMDGSTPSVSDMTCDGKTSWGLFTVSWGWDFSDTRMIRVYVDSSNQFWADFVKFIKWGARIDVTHANFTSWDFVKCFVTAWR